MLERPLRIVTAVAAYDGHDASVLALNRALLAGARPVEVIYLGFNMKSDSIATAVLQEDADAVAISSYNGGHLQFFPRLAERLADLGMERVLLFVGGGGTIIKEDAAILENQGVEKIYGPGWPLDVIAEDMTKRIFARRGSLEPAEPPVPEVRILSQAGLTRLLTLAEHGKDTFPKFFDQMKTDDETEQCKVVAIAGDGGSGKSTLIDELISRFIRDLPEKRIAVIANDPTTRNGGVESAFLADRVRMNHIYDYRVWFRSVATGRAYLPLSPALPIMIRILRAAGFQLILVETPGSGQTGIDLSGLEADLVIYLKGKDFGSPIQLEKDQLLRDAGILVMNKADLEGSEASYAEIREYLRRSGKKDTLFPTIAKSAMDPGVERLYTAVCVRLGFPGKVPSEETDIFSYAKKSVLVPHHRRAYLAEIVDRVRGYDLWAAGEVRNMRKDPGNLDGLDAACARLLEKWPEDWQELSLQAARRMGIEGYVVTPNGLRLPRVALPDPDDRVESLRFLLEEGLPGMFPFATGIHPFRPLTASETTRQFAGLRGPEETNRRLHLLAEGVARPRLSIAFDGITLYGGDSDDDPGSIGKIGEGGVAIDSWEDMKLLLSGFTIPEISTSMTINGPAPVILAMYFVAAQELELERSEAEKGSALSEEEREDVRKRTLRELRGTVQADILKEVQAQNESIFQPDFAVRLLGDVQEWFIANGVKHFYSLSVSGYHIGEAGATPVQELAFTMANGFTYLENFLARGMSVNEVAPSLSFFFKVSHEAEWLAYGAVCRRIWAIALRDVYGADERSQKLRFHTQTSGRALQSEEWDTLNPIRLAYHALLGLLANANSLHVDSADEPITTPGEKWVRQATMIPNYLREEAEGFLVQNLLSGSYAFRAIMREVQEKVLDEFDRIDQLGGVGPATELGYQRRCIAEMSSRYERERRREGGEGEGPLRKVIGYNVHELPEGHPDRYPKVMEVVRPGPADWERQLTRIRDFRERHREDSTLYIGRLKDAARRGDNIFAELIETVRHATLGEITRALADVGGRFRKMV